MHENSAGRQAGVLIIAAGLKGAIGTTVAAAAEMMKNDPGRVAPYLTTGYGLSGLGSIDGIGIAGWDTNKALMSDAAAGCKVLESSVLEPLRSGLDKIDARPAPGPGLNPESAKEKIKADIDDFRVLNPGMLPVFVNLLPAGTRHELHRFSSLSELYRNVSAVPPDIAYAAAAIEAKIPVVNFTPNNIEIPALLNEAEARGVPVCGRDGKTGQTYFKVVLASALRARSLLVNGWYSLNILGNADGLNLEDPETAACKLDNKTGVLEEVLGYSPGKDKYADSSHRVRIDYYPPRGDAKEAWDVVDFEGLFGLPMSLRVNLQGRDSILAAPMVIDLARWMAALSLAGRQGPVPELAFYFKKPGGKNAPLTFEDQLRAIARLETECRQAHGHKKEKGGQ